MNDATELLILGLLILFAVANWDKLNTNFITILEWAGF